LRSYNYLISDAGAQDGHYVELLESRLMELLNALLHEVKVDEGWYTSEYPDVSAAIKTGAFKNGQQHFERSGFQEGRLPAQGWSLLGSLAR
jgi:hypothetical protein